MAQAIQSILVQNSSSEFLGKKQTQIASKKTRDGASYPIHSSSEQQLGISKKKKHAQITSKKIQRWSRPANQYFPVENSR
jgi:hypothetical protein